MLQTIEKKLVIVNREAKLIRYTNDSCLDAADIFYNVEKKNRLYLLNLYVRKFSY